MTDSGPAEAQAFWMSVRLGRAWCHFKGSSPAKALEKAEAFRKLNPPRDPPSATGLFTL